jgi:hypothetical protein
MTTLAPVTTLLALLNMLVSSSSPPQERTYANRVIREILALLGAIPEASPLYVHLSKFKWTLANRKITTATPGVLAEYVMTVTRTLGNFADKRNFKKEATALVTACRNAEIAYEELVETTDDVRSRVQSEKTKTSESKRNDPTKNPLHTGGGFAGLGEDSSDEDENEDSSDEESSDGNQKTTPIKTKSSPYDLIATRYPETPSAPTKAKVVTTPRALIEEPTTTPGAPIKPKVLTFD